MRKITKGMRKRMYLSDVAWFVVCKNSRKRLKIKNILEIFKCHFSFKQFKICQRIYKIFEIF